LKFLFFVFIGFGFFSLGGCLSNRPYPIADKNENIYYTDFDQLPKYLEPARAYSSDEYRILALVYEPPLQFHYLKRPYTLDPLTVQEIPKPRYFNHAGLEINESSSDQDIAIVVYRFVLKSNIYYQDHPAFVKNDNGDLVYGKLTLVELGQIESLSDFKKTSTRLLSARDYELQIKRLANPTLACPISPTLAVSLAGFADYQNELSKQLSRVREIRKKQAGARYLQDKDEAENPIHLSYDALLPGVRVLDDNTFEIVLLQRYPQILYWMTLSFFAPMPWEALAFYEQPGLIKKNIILNRCPVGTGPYYLSRYEPNRMIELKKNPRFDHEVYPSEGSLGDRENGLLVDAGKKLPFIDRIVMSYEKESIPRWNKFLQGYYDFSGVTEDNFDKVVQVSDSGVGIAGEFSQKGISLLVEPASSISYWGFNMLDPVVGGLTEEKKKLRRAISIAVDMEEYVQIFLNGRGMLAKGPLPPEIFGHEEMGINSFIYDDVNGKVFRKSIDEAKKLLAEAGYPNGMSTAGPLVLYFDGTFTGPGSQSLLAWMSKQFKKLNIQLQFRNTTYRQFREKMEKGTGQIFMWGWNADYPDPENFLFLLYGSNQMANGGGENAANYNSASFNQGFETMRNLPDSAFRKDVIAKMTHQLQEDAPWIWGVFPVTYALKHDWVHNVKLGDLANNQRKYHRLDISKREKNRELWNKPVYWPLLFLVLFLPFLAIYLFRMKQK
jgi:ABC-type transport system substrate-binding protein